MKTKKYKNGVNYRGEFVKEKRHGKGEQVWPDNRSYEGDFKEDMMHGKGVYRWPDGKQYFGEFVSDIMTGNGILIENRSKIMFGEFENSQLQGKGAIFQEEDKHMVIKVGKSWNMGLLPNGFKIEINNANSNIASVVQYINNNPYEWIPKEELKKYDEQLKSLKQDLVKTQKTPTKDEEVQKLKNQLESARQELIDQSKEVRETLETKNAIENKLMEALKKQRELQISLIKKASETEKKLKEKITVLTQEQEAISAQMKEESSKIENLSKENQNLKEQLSNANVDFSKFNQELEEAKKKIEELKQDNLIIKEKYQNEIQQLKHENEVLKTQSIITVESPRDHVSEEIDKKEELKKKKEELKRKEEDLKRREEELKRREDDSLKRTPRTSFIKEPTKTPTIEGEKVLPWKGIQLKKVEPKSEVVKQPEKEVTQIDFRSVLKKKSEGGETPRELRKSGDSSNDLLKSPTTKPNSEKISPRDELTKLEKKPSVYDLKLKFQSANLNK